MPVHEYKCLKCDSKYEVFHKVKEDTGKIICPKCNSNEYKKLLSGFSASVSSGSSSCESGSCGINPHAGGGCHGGMCGLN